jgi:nitrate reductase delta subunit
MRNSLVRYASMTRVSPRNAERAQALGRVKEWTRSRFSLPDAATILVSERACALPGCPPLETHVLFLPPGGKRHHFKVFKPVGEVGLDDLPFAWLKDTLIVPEGAGCDCC